MKFKQLYAACFSELIKAVYSKVFWIILAGFSMIPLMGALFSLIVRNPSISEGSPLLQAKVNLAAFSADWQGYLGFINMAISAAGVVGFGFITSWIFGREYSDHTFKDILVLPVSRAIILASRFIAVSIWGIFISIWIVSLGSLLALLLELPGFSSGLYIGFFVKLLKISILVIFVSYPVALIASWGKGYMAPLGFVIFTLAIGQLLGVLGFGSYSPWSVPALYAGIAGKEKEHLDTISFVLVLITGIAGILGTYFYWKNTDF